MYAAEKERYRSTENHPLLKAAEVTYEYTHTPPPPAVTVGREKMAISLEDEEIIAGVVKSSRSRNATEFMLEEAALRWGKTYGRPIIFFILEAYPRYTHVAYKVYTRGVYIRTQTLVAREAPLKQCRIKAAAAYIASVFGWGEWTRMSLRGGWRLLTRRDVRRRRDARWTTTR